MKSLPLANLAALAFIFLPLGLNVLLKLSLIINSAPTSIGPAAAKFFQEGINA